jgi:CheY-like chemotaxis protein
MREKPLILVVDDEQDLREIASLKLNASGFETILARDAKEAVALTKERHPDLVLMDIYMPGGSGTDAALEIKQDPETKDTKIAFLSSLKDPWPQTLPARNDLAKSLGMEDFIDKTEDLDLTVSKVREILARTQQKDPPSF